MDPRAEQNMTYVRTAVTLHRYVGLVMEPPLGATQPVNKRPGDAMPTLQ